MSPSTELGEAQELQRLGDRKEVVDFHLQGPGQRRQVGMATIGFPGHSFKEARQQVG
jgi:hypothetical protein